MKEKRTYSLTAKERKAKRAAESGKTAKEDTPVPKSSDVRVRQETAMLESQSRSKRAAIITGAVIAVAILCIIVGLLVPVVSYLVNPYRGYDDVIARFNLSNGMVLEYVIDEDDYDTAATNFIFLAKNGYFDNTVFFDGQKNSDGKGWLRFGGYESQPTGASQSDYEVTHHHAQNRTYVENFKALPNSSFPDDVMIKFKYRLNPDENGTKQALLAQVGVLTYLYSDTSTEFQFACSNDAPQEMTVRSSSGSVTTDRLESTMVGHPLNDKTVDNIIAIRDTRVAESSVSSGFMWTPPSPNVYINKVKVYNLDDSKWRDFDFISYLDEEGKNRLASWG